MRILLDQGVHDLRNQGNNAMLLATIERLRVLWPDAAIEALTLGPQLMRLSFPAISPVHPDGRHVSTVGRHGIYRFSRLVPSSSLRLLFELREELWHRRAVRTTESLLRNTQPVSMSRDNTIGEQFSLQENTDEVQNVSIDQVGLFEAVDLFIATGGQYLADNVKEAGLGVLKRLGIALRQGIPTAMVGQGIGPIEDSELRKRAKDVLPFVDLILARENLTAPYLLQSLGVEPDRVFVTGDDAIELAYGVRLPQLGTGIGVNMRKAHYTEVERNHLDAVRTVLRDASERYKATLIAVPISHNPGESDLRTIRRLFKGQKDVLINWRKFETPMNTINSVSRCRVVVTGGYHPAVFALAQGIPAICLTKSELYSIKFLGLVEQFDVGCNIINLDDPNFQETFTATLEDLWQTAEQLRPRILELAWRQIELNRKGYQHLFDVVETKRKNLALN